MSRPSLPQDESASSSQGSPAQSKRPPVGIIAFILVAVAITVVAIQMCSTAAPITVSVNGAEYTLRGAKTMQVAIKESGLPVNPGDHISLQGNILQRSAGYPFYALINDETETHDYDYALHNGDVIVLKDGLDSIEEYDAVEQPVPYGASIVGTGSIHTFSEGKNGVLEIRTGRETGEVVEKRTVSPVNVIETRADPIVGDDKVVALTFDSGPSSKYTKYVLKVLADNDARATFFCTGTAIENGGASIVKKAAELGCQVCTHSYDNAAVTKGDMSKLSAEEQVDQIERGISAIEEATGQEASRVVRLGDYDMDELAIVNLSTHIDAELGWTVDTGDWVNTSEDEIYKILMAVKPGDIVRMHDGGSHQSATVKALNRALPKLKEQGFSFITADEMMKYPTTSETE